MGTRNKLIGILILLTLTFVLPPVTLGQGKGKGGPPSWAPAHGYRAKIRHVYFPDYNFYFDVQRNVYIYLNVGNWQVGVKLPLIYAGFDLKSAVKVEMDLDSDTPQKYNADHVAKYKVKGKDVQRKTMIGNHAKGKMLK